MTTEAWILLVALVLVIFGCFEQEIENRSLRKELEKKVHRNGKYGYKQIR